MSSPYEADDACKIFLGGLPWSITPEILEAHFIKFGPVSSIDIRKDRNTGKPRGFGFMVFASPETVDKVCAEGVIHDVGGRNLDVKRASKQGSAPPPVGANNFGVSNGRQYAGTSNATTVSGSPALAGPQPSVASPAPISSYKPLSDKYGPEFKLFIGGLDQSINTESLRDYFKKFGELVDCIVMIDNYTGNSKGFGFVKYKDKEQMEAALNNPGGHNLAGRFVELRVATKKAAFSPNAAMSPSNPGGVVENVNKKYYHPHMIGNALYRGLETLYGREGFKAGYGTYALGGLESGGFGLAGWEGGEYGYGGKIASGSYFSQFSGNKKLRGDTTDPPS